MRPGGTGVLLGENAAGVGREIEIACAEMGGGEFVEQVGGDGVAEVARHLNDLREGCRLAAAMAGELADNVDLFSLFGGGCGVGFAVGDDRLDVAGLGDLFGEGLGAYRGGKRRQASGDGAEESDSNELREAVGARGHGKRHP